MYADGVPTGWLLLSYVEKQSLASTCLSATKLPFSSPVQRGVGITQE